MQQYYGDQVRIIPKNEKKVRRMRVSGKNRGVKFVVFTVVLCAVALFVVSLLAPLPADKTRLFDRTWYFVKTHETEEYEKSLLESENVKERGGGGFVINDGKFCITVAVFDTFDKANSVVNKTENSTVYELNLSGGVIDRNDNLKGAMTVHAKIYNQLISLANDYDSLLCSDALAMFVVDELIMEVESVQSNLDSEKYPTVAIYLKKVLQSLNLVKNDENHTVPSRLRYCVSEVIYLRSKIT